MAPAAVTRVDVRLNWPMVVLLVSTMVIVSTVILVLVLTDHLPMSALSALAAWVAGMIKGALIPAFRYRAQGGGVDFRVSSPEDSELPPPLPPKDGNS